MKLGIVGSSEVARSIATGLLRAGNSTMLSSRSPDQPREAWSGQMPSLSEWVREQKAAGFGAEAGTFAEAAAFGEVVFNCTLGEASVEALTAAGAENLRGKILVDVANPLDFSHGSSLSLSIANNDSLAETIQRAFPDARVVKTLNTVNAALFFQPGRVPGIHHVFVAGNDDEAKTWVKDTLLTSWFGWQGVIDLGDLTGARGMEMYMLLWFRLLGAMGTPVFNISVVKG